MKNVIVLNGENYVKVSNITNHGLFAKIFYVNRRQQNETEYHAGIGFLNYEDAVEYKNNLEKYLKMICVITETDVYTHI